MLGQGLCLYRANSFLTDVTPESLCVLRSEEGSDGELGIWPLTFFQKQMEIQPTHGVS